MPEDHPHHPHHPHDPHSHTPHSHEPWGGGGSASICQNSCRYAADDYCDDGGSGSEYSMCQYGSDCTDCSARSAGAVCADADYTGITLQGSAAECNQLGFAFLDADFGAQIREACPLTCLQCTVAASPPPSPPTGMCSESCQYPSDDTCDDGGSGSQFSICAYGSDCTDCGTRSTGTGSSSGSTTCVDASSTGFTIGGNSASCSQLLDHCDDATHGATIQAVCPLTCDSCWTASAAPPPPVGQCECMSVWTYSGATYQGCTNPDR